MNQDDIILIEAGTPDFEHLKEAIAYAEETGSYIRFYMEPSRSAPVYEVGDKIEAEFDNGWGPAEVTGNSSDGVSIKYGPRGKYSTTVGRGSVRHPSFRANRRSTTPAGLQVKAYEGTWSTPIESHRPKGGY